MANVKISDLTEYVNAESTDVVPVVDLVNDQTKKIKIENVAKANADGTAAAPGIAFAADKDTGIYRPTTNQFGISTAGTSRLVIDETGDITVGGDLTVNSITLSNDLTINGDLTVNGTTTTINSTTLQVDDKNIELGTVATPTDVTADGGGITLKGTTDHTIIWTDSTDSWDLSEHLNIASAKEFRIAGTKVLDATSLGSAVVSSSLTSVGTIGTGVWNGTPIGTDYIADDAVTPNKLADTAVTAGSYTAASITVDAQGRLTSASSNTIPTNNNQLTNGAGYITSVNLGTTTTSSTNTITNDQGTNATLNAATTSVAGLMTSTDKTKLDGIETGATADQTGAEIKTAYESQSNTNAFTDAEKTKLAGIATGATNVTNNNQLTNGAGYITSTISNTSPMLVFDETDTTTRARFVVTGGKSYLQAGASGSGGSSSSGDLIFSGYLGANINNFQVQSGGSAQTIWHSGNDGSGSGLDADTLDGYQTTSTGDRWGVIPVVAAGGVMEVGRYIDFHNADGSAADYTNRLDAGTSGQITLNGNRILTTADEGSGNGLDADTLDGQQPSVTAVDNSIVQRNSLGYIYTNYFNTTPNTVTDGSTITQICIETGNDGFIRHGTAAAVRTFLGVNEAGSIPQNAKTAAYTLLATDAGKHISITTGGVTVPSGVFSTGDAVTIYNNSTSNQTITASGVTLRIAGSATSGNKTLAQYGLATLLCVASNVFVIGGAGVS